MVAGYYNIFVFLALVHFSLSANPKIAQKQLKRHEYRLKAIEARQEVDEDKLLKLAEQFSMLESLIEGIVNNTKSTSVTQLENGGGKLEVSSDIASVFSNSCAEDDIREILKEFSQEQELFDLKAAINDVNTDITRAIDDLHAIRNATESVQERCKQSDQEILFEMKTGMESLNSSIAYLTQKLSDIDEIAEMAFNTCMKADIGKQETKVKNGKHIIKANNGKQGNKANNERQVSNANNGRQVITDRPTSCKEIFDDISKESGVYTVYPAEQGAPVRVYCDMETDGGGWTVFQRRQDGSVGFYRKWSGYEFGFGKLEGEFWLGNKHISEMTIGCCYELRIDMEDFEGNKAYAKYGTFQVLSQAENYTLVVGNYSGNAGDSLTYHSGMSFSTKDRDNDAWDYINCAKIYDKGAWWYRRCYHSSLNGRYLHGGVSSLDGINWFHWKKYYSLKMTEMKSRNI